MLQEKKNTEKQCLNLFKRTKICHIRMLYIEKYKTVVKISLETLLYSDEG